MGQKHILNISNTRVSQGRHFLSMMEQPGGFDVISILVFLFISYLLGK